jgi:LysM repeat protein
MVLKPPFVFKYFQEVFMKKFTIGLLVCVLAFAALSCKSTSSGVNLEGEITQEKVDSALTQIYDTYRTKLIMDGAQDYTVAAGDTLTAITRKHYGPLTEVGEAGPNNGFYFPVIMMAADSEIVDPDKIEPGMKLKIVDLKKNLANPVSRAAIKDCLKDVAYVYNKKGSAVTEEGLTKLANSL